eukprot:CAMPEP_0183359520 /NCGR_PEP_ID=MMETSP0164_2-20130417/52458_1 /TAXON_ID=221442 /ORGANISM="Coccolithus pelagicus ssp braarudi, Strain PLY182g" /LENGTH=46 /DNA_ID= /DNA_START= /DNA_END= /DNA_ORIENTATION=
MAAVCTPQAQELGQIEAAEALWSSVCNSSAAIGSNIARLLQARWGL